MSILIGLKNTHSHGSYHGAEGFEGFSMDGTVITVIKEGTRDELVKFVADQRKLNEKGKEEMDKLENDRENDFNDQMTEKEYDNRYDKASKKMMIGRFDKLMILEGETI